jgi:hypothetical protein
MTGVAVAADGGAQYTGIIGAGQLMRAPRAGLPARSAGDNCWIPCAAFAHPDCAAMSACVIDCRQRIPQGVIATSRKARYC